MKKIISIIATTVVGAVMFAFGGATGYTIANEKAFKSVCNSEQTDILELIIKNDKHAEIVSTYYDYENGTGYLVLKDKNIYTINVKVEKVAPFRYEWVEVDL